MNEKEFLIQLAIDAYNRQFNKNLSIADCDLKSITPAYGTSLGYEINTVRMDDFLRLRIYLNIDRFDALSSYRLESDEGIYDGKGSLIDEVWVAFGTVDRYWIESNTYRFTTWYVLDDDRIMVINTEADEHFITEDTEEYILLDDGN